MALRVNRDLLIRSSRLTAVGFEFAGAIVVALIGGYYLDQFAGTSPLFLFLFLAGGLYGAVRLLLWSLKKTSQ
ncbi:MAG: AtpZ/AtpI family protein [Candidatus Binatia bacterium]